MNLLLDFTGIDYYGALFLLYEIGDIKKEIQRSQKAGILGLLAPSLHQSGDIRYTGRITKQGNARIKYLTEGAKNANRFDPKLRSFYERIASRRGSHKLTSSHP